MALTTTLIRVCSQVVDWFFARGMQGGRRPQRPNTTEFLEWSPTAEDMLEMSEALQLDDSEVHLLIVRLSVCVVFHSPLPWALGVVCF